MTTDELIQLMRTCSMAQVRMQLEAAKMGNPEAFMTIEAFYKLASKQKPK